MPTVGPTPGGATAIASKLRALLDCAVERGWFHANSAARVRRLGVTEHNPWSADVLAPALEAASRMLRLAIVDGLNLGQPITDFIRMRHQWVNNGVIGMPIRHLPELRRSDAKIRRVTDWTPATARKYLEKPLAYNVAPGAAETILPRLAAAAL